MFLGLFIYVDCTILGLMSVNTGATRHSPRPELSPLSAARHHLDIAYKSEKRDRKRKLIRGADISALLETPIHGKTLSDAGELLRTSYTSPDLDWGEWFRLKVSLLTAKQRVFSHIIFGNEAWKAQRKRVHKEAYHLLGSLLEEGESLLVALPDVSSKKRVAGAMGEILTMALLNRANPGTAGARISSVHADLFGKIDASYDFLAPSNRHEVLNLQIKTSGETIEYPERSLLQFGINSILGGYNDAMATRQLVIRDVHNDLGESDRRDLHERSMAVVSEIHGSSLFAEKLGIAGLPFGA